MDNPSLSDAKSQKTLMSTLEWRFSHTPGAYNDVTEPGPSKPFITKLMMITGNQGIFPVENFDHFNDHFFSIHRLIVYSLVNRSQSPSDFQLPVNFINNHELF
jgi:hypothetical protein